MSVRTLVLVDGEHYPPVTIDAIAALRARGYDVVAAVDLGGGEKLDGALVLGPVPIVRGSTQRAALQQALATHAPEVVFDLSDAPVVDDAARALLGATALVAGARYEGAGFRIDPPPAPARATRCPQIIIAGSGKRTGKTAIGAALARHLIRRGVTPVIVAMGRGGPAEPILTRGDLQPPSVDDLIALAEAGHHAATDAFEDAVTARCATVGARRAGVGLAGATAYDTVAAAAAIAADLNPDVVIFEGSGTALPPAAADAFVLIAGPLTSERDQRSLAGIYRLLRADLVIATMAGQAAATLDSAASTGASSLLDELALGVPLIETTFHPTPLEPVAGKKILYATTAPLGARDEIAAHLRDAHGAVVVGMTCALGDRVRLRQELAEAEGTYEVLVTEIKAAGIDVAARAARAAGASVVLADNTPANAAIGVAFDALWAHATQAYAGRRDA